MEIHAPTAISTTEKLLIIAVFSAVVKKQRRIAIHLREEKRQENTADSDGLIPKGGQLCKKSGPLGLHRILEKTSLGRHIDDFIVLIGSES